MSKQSSGKPTPSHMVTPPGIQLNPSMVHKGALGVYCTVPIAESQLFGPFAGEVILEGDDEEVNYRFAWEVYDQKTNKLLHIINATKPRSGNWMRYVNCARFFEEQNIVSVQNGCEIFYKAIRPISAGEELLTWYAPFGGQSKRQGNRRKPVVLDNSGVKETKKIKKKRKSSEHFDDKMKSLLLYKYLTKDEKINKLKTEKKSKVSTESDRNELNTPEKSETKTASDRKPLEKVQKAKADVSMTSDTEVTTRSKVTGHASWLTPDMILHSEHSPDKVFQFVIRNEHKVKTKNGGTMYACDICGAPYNRMFSLKRHVIRQHINAKYLTLADITNCMVNVVQQEKNVQAKCDLKKTRKAKSTSAMGDLDMPGLYRCFVCSRLFDVAEELKKHECEGKDKSKLHCCPVCPLKFILKMDLTRHSISHTEGIDTPFPCKICGKSFMSSTSMKKHIQFHSGNNFSCKVCPSRFSSITELRKHTSNKHIHLASKQSVGILKKSVMKSKSKFKIHNKQKTLVDMNSAVVVVDATVVDEKSVKPTAVSSPATPAKSRKKKNRKMKLMQHSSKPSDKNSLSVDKPFSCQVCGKAFPNEARLKMHMSYHKDRVYTCRFCSVTHVKLASYRKHLQSVHPESLQNGVLIRDTNGDKQRTTSAQVKQAKTTSVPAQQTSPVVPDKQDTEEEKNNVMKKCPVECDDTVVESFQRNVDSEETGEVELWEGEIKSPKSGKRSRFNFACTVCKKKFNCYVNMCRHRRLAHRARKYGQPTLLRQREAAKLRDTVIVSDYIPIPPEMNYANVAENIATNLNHYLDGGQDAIASCHKYIKTLGTNSGLKSREEMPGTVTWTKFNFPSSFQPWEGVVGYDIDEELLKVYDDLDIDKPAEGRNIRRKCRGANPEEGCSDNSGDAKNGRVANFEADSSVDNVPKMKIDKSVCESVDKENSSSNEAKTATEWIPHATVKCQDNMEDCAMRADAATKQNAQTTTTTKTEPPVISESDGRREQALVSSCLDLISIKTDVIEDDDVHKNDSKGHRCEVTVVSEVESARDGNQRSVPMSVQPVKVEDLDEEVKAVDKFEGREVTVWRASEATVDLDDLPSESESRTSESLEGKNQDKAVIVKNEEVKETFNAELVKIEENIKTACQDDDASSSQFLVMSKDVCEAASVESLDNSQTENIFLRQNSDGPPLLMPAMVRNDRWHSSGDSSDEGSFGSPPPLLSPKELDDELQSQSEFSSDRNHECLETKQKDIEFDKEKSSNVRILSEKENEQLALDLTSGIRILTEKENEQLSLDLTSGVRILTEKENEQLSLDLTSGDQPSLSNEQCYLISSMNRSQDSSLQPRQANGNTVSDTVNSRFELKESAKDNPAADTFTKFCEQEETSTRTYPCDSSDNGDLSSKQNLNRHLFLENHTQNHSMKERQYDNGDKDNINKNPFVPTQIVGKQNDCFVASAILVGYARKSTNDRSKMDDICKSININQTVETESSLECITKDISLVIKGKDTILPSDNNDSLCIMHKDASANSDSLSTTDNTIATNGTSSNGSVTATKDAFSVVNQSSQEIQASEQNNKQTSLGYKLHSHPAIKKKSKMSKAINLEKIVEKMKATESHTEQKDVKTTKEPLMIGSNFVCSKNVCTKQPKNDGAVVFQLNEVEHLSKHHDCQEKDAFEVSSRTVDKIPADNDKSDFVNKNEVDHDVDMISKCPVDDKFKQSKIYEDDTTKSTTCEKLFDHVTVMDSDTKVTDENGDSNEHKIMAIRNDEDLCSSVVKDENVFDKPFEKVTKINNLTNSEGPLEQNNMEVASKTTKCVLKKNEQDFVDFSSERNTWKPSDNNNLNDNCRNHLKKETALSLEHEQNNLFPDSTKIIPLIPSVESDDKVPDAPNRCTCSSDTKMETMREAKLGFKNSSNIDSVCLSVDCHKTLTSSVISDKNEPSRKTLTDSDNQICADDVVTPLSDDSNTHDKTVVAVTPENLPNEIKCHTFESMLFNEKNIQSQFPPSKENNLAFPVSEGPTGSHSEDTSVLGTDSKEPADALERNHSESKNAMTTQSENSELETNARQASDTHSSLLKHDCSKQPEEDVYRSNNIFKVEEDCSTSSSFINIDSDPSFSDANKLDCLSASSFSSEKSEFKSSNILCDNPFESSTINNSLLIEKATESSIIQNGVLLEKTSHTSSVLESSTIEKDLPLETVGSSEHSIMNSDVSMKTSSKNPASSESTIIHKDVFVEETYGSSCSLKYSAIHKDLPVEKNSSLIHKDLPVGDLLETTDEFSNSPKSSIIHTDPAIKKINDMSSSSESSIIHTDSLVKDLPVENGSKLSSPSELIVVDSDLPADKSSESSSFCESHTLDKDLPLNKTSEPDKDLPLNKTSEPDKDLPLDKTSEPDKDLPLDKTSEPDKDLPLDKTSEPDKDLPLNKTSEPDKDLPLNKTSEPDKDLPLDKTSEPGKSEQSEKLCNNSISFETETSNSIPSNLHQNKNIDSLASNKVTTTCNSSISQSIDKLPESIGDCKDKLRDSVGNSQSKVSDSIDVDSQKTLSDSIDGDFQKTLSDSIDGDSQKTLSYSIDVDSQKLSDSIDGDSQKTPSDSIDGDSQKTLSDSIDGDSQNILSALIDCDFHKELPDSIDGDSQKKLPHSINGDSQKTLNNSIDVDSAQTHASEGDSVKDKGDKLRDGEHSTCGLADPSSLENSSSSLVPRGDPSTSDVIHHTDKCDATATSSANVNSVESNPSKDGHKHDMAVGEKTCCNNCLLETLKECTSARAELSDLDSKVGGNMENIQSIDLVGNVDAMLKPVPDELQFERVNLLKNLYLRQNGTAGASTEGDTVTNDDKVSGLGSASILSTTSNMFRHFLRPTEDPLQNYEHVMFGKQGKIVCVCAICRRQFLSVDLLLRHHWKKHPSIDFKFIEVEQGSDVDLLYFPWPCNFGLLASALPIAEDYRSLGIYKCTRCASKFKNINRLHVHIINCDPNREPVIPNSKKKRIQKRMRAKMVDFKAKEAQLQNKLNSVLTDSNRREGKHESRGFTGCRKRRMIRNNVDAVIKIRKKRNYELLYNPHNHVRRREMISLLDTHQCSGCKAKFKTLHLLERHATKCSNKETLQSLKPVQNKFIDEVTQKRRHICHYCTKHFIYLKSLANHYRAFCPVRKEKRRNGQITDDDLEHEKQVRTQLESQEQEVEQDKTDGKKRKGGWPKGMKRKKGRKKRTWTIVKRRKQSSPESEGAHEIISSPLWNLDLYQDYSEVLATDEPVEEEVHKPQTDMDKDDDVSKMPSSTNKTVGDTQETPEQKNVTPKKSTSKAKGSSLKKNLQKSTKKVSAGTGKSPGLSATRKLYTEDKLSAEDNTSSEVSAKSKDSTSEPLIGNKKKQKIVKSKPVKKVKQISSLLNSELPKKKKRLGNKSASSLKIKKEKYRNENEDLDTLPLVIAPDSITEPLSAGTGKKSLSKGHGNLTKVENNDHETEDDKPEVMLLKKTKNKTISKKKTADKLHCAKNILKKSKNSRGGIQKTVDCFVEEGIVSIKTLEKTLGTKTKPIKSVPKKRASSDVTQKSNPSNSIIHELPVIIAKNKNTSVVKIFKVDTSNQLFAKKGQKKTLKVLSQSTPTVIKSISRKKSPVVNKSKKKILQMKDDLLEMVGDGLADQEGSFSNGSNIADSLLQKCDKTSDQTATSSCSETKLASASNITRKTTSRTKLFPSSKARLVSGKLKGKPSPRTGVQANLLCGNVFSVTPETQSVASPQKSPKKLTSGPKCTITETLDEVASNWQGKPTGKTPNSPKCKAIKRLFQDRRSRSPSPNINIDTVFKKQKANSASKVQSKRFVNSRSLSAEGSVKQKSPQKTLPVRARKMKNILI